MGRETREADNRSSARRRAEEHQSFERTAFKIPEGMKITSLKPDTVRRLDFLNYPVGKGNPYADEGTLHYERTFFVHARIGPTESSYVCPAKTAGLPCPVCDWCKKKKMSDDSEATVKLIKALEPKERQLFNVIDVDARDRGVQLLEASFHNLGKQVDAAVRNTDDNRYDNFAFWKSGLTTRLGVIGKSMGTGKPFAYVENVQFIERSQTYDKTMAEQVACLDDLLIILPYAELKAIFLQEAEEPEDAAPPPPAAKAKPQPTDDDDLPPPKAKAKAPPPVADDDEPAPPPKPKAKAPPVADDDDWGDAPAAAPAPKAKAKPAPADDDERVPPPKAKAKAPPVADDDERVPPPKAKAKAPPVADVWDDNWGDDPPPKKK